MSETSLALEPPQDVAYVYLTKDWLTPTYSNKLHRSLTYYSRSLYTKNITYQEQKSKVSKILNVFAQTNLTSRALSSFSL